MYMLLWDMYTNEEMYDVGAIQLGRDKESAFMRWPSNVVTIKQNRTSFR